MQVLRNHNSKKDRWNRQGERGFLLFNESAIGTSGNPAGARFKKPSEEVMK